MDPLNPEQRQVAKLQGPPRFNTAPMQHGTNARGQQAMHGHHTYSHHPFDQAGHHFDGDATMNDAAG